MDAAGTVRSTVLKSPPPTASTTSVIKVRQVVESVIADIRERGDAAVSESRTRAASPAGTSRT